MTLDSGTEKPEDYLPDDVLNDPAKCQPDDTDAEDEWNPKICVECGWHIHSEHHLNSCGKDNGKDNNENQSG